MCVARHVLGITAAGRRFSVAKLFFADGLGNACYFPLSVGATSILWPPALSERFWRRFGLEILDGIGSTDVLPTFISNVAGRVRPGSGGEIVPGYEARLVDDDGAPVPTGRVGHLLIKGDSTCACYWNQHERTTDTIDGHWIRTGHTYRQDADGYCWHAGRAADMLKAGGIRVSLVEVENVLMEHAAVRECAVVGHRDHDGLVKPAAYVVPAVDVTPDRALEQELLAFVRSKLAEYKRPLWIRFTTRLPKTATGKAQRFRLRDPQGGDAGGGR